MLAEHERRLRHTHFLGPHDLVGATVLQHAVLVNAGLVRERIAPDDRLVGLHRLAGQGRQQLAGGEDFTGVDPRVERQPIDLTRVAITTSSRDAFPARSPMPLTVHST